MGTISEAFSTTYRDYETEGVPASGAHEPVKSEIRLIGATIESVLAVLSTNGVASLTYDTRANLEADLAHEGGTVALVYADLDPANNDLYVKEGASGGGSWEKTGVLDGDLSPINGRLDTLEAWADGIKPIGLLASRASGIVIDTGANTMTLTGAFASSGVQYYALPNVTLPIPAGTRSALVLDISTNTPALIGYADVGSLTDTQIILAEWRNDIKTFTSGVAAYTIDGEVAASSEVPFLWKAARRGAELTVKGETTFTDLALPSTTGGRVSAFIEQGAMIALALDAESGTVPMQLRAVTTDGDLVTLSGLVVEAGTPFSEDILAPNDLVELQFYYGSASSGQSVSATISVPVALNPAYLQTSELIDETSSPVTVSTTGGAVNYLGNSSGSFAGYMRTSTVNPTGMLDLSTGDFFSYSGEIQDGDTALVGIAYKDMGTGEMLGYECRGPGTYTDYELSPPPGATHAAFCGFGGFTVKLVDKKIKPIFLGGAGVGEKAVYADASAAPDGDGSAAAPYQTVTEALMSVSNSAMATVIVSEGDYRETLPFAALPTGEFTIANREGHRVRILGSTKLGPFTKTGGLTNTYQAPFAGAVPAWTRYDDPIFEDGRPSKEIAPADYHPLQKNLTHRLPFTPIVAVASTAEVDATPGTYCLDDGVLYLHPTDGGNPETNGYSYEVISRPANSYNDPATTTKKVRLNLKGLQFYFTSQGLILRGNAINHLQDVVSLGTPGAGAIRPHAGANFLLDCEAGFCDGDSFNGHFSAFTGYASLSDNRSNYPTTLYDGCWGHDSFDDGESSHEQHNVKMVRSLMEFNGDSGCRPSNDATYHIASSVFRYNGWQVGHGGSAGKGEGVAAVNPALNPARLGCRVFLVNCLSYGNNTGYGVISQDNNRMELVNCVARDNTTAEFYAGAGELVLRNCRATNADPAKIKVTDGTGVINVYNDEMVT